MRRILYPQIIDLLACEGEPPADPPPADPPPADPPVKGLLDGQVPPSDPPADEFTLPEKFLVKDAEGNEDWQEITKKLHGSYQHLEKRLGSGDVPPESAEGYEIADYLPEGFTRDTEGEAPIMSEFHKLGLSNAQAQGIMTLFGQKLSEGVESEKASMESAMQTLQSDVWPKPEEYERNLQRSNFALSLADNDLVQRISNDPKMMNNPDLIQLLAFFGSEFEEDHPADSLDAGEIENIEQLRTSPAYLDAKHPDHKRTVDKVTAAYGRGYKSAS